MKAAYFGIDALQNCLELLHRRNVDVVAVFTIGDEDYDTSHGIRAFAQEHHIPIKTSRATEEDIRALETSGVELSVSAGYPWLIPLSNTIKQINIHPSYLPEGRGAWPMPVCLLRDIPSGVTLHKLSENFDEGDILIQRRIPLSEGENLETLGAKISNVAQELLDEFLDDSTRLWEGAWKQSGGEHWHQPTDENRTVRVGDDVERVSRLMRAFYGYGCLCPVSGVTVEVQKGHVLIGEGVEASNHLSIPLSGGVLAAEKWRPYFRGILLSDKERVEAIRAKYRPELSSFTFALLFCWKQMLNLSIYIEDNFFVVRGDGYYFCPVGASDRVEEFLRGMLSLGESVTLRFCDEASCELIKRWFPEEIEVELSEDDSEYIIENGVLDKLPGGSLTRRRNDFHHYSSLEPPPEVERITADNLHSVRELSELCRDEDYSAESAAIENFFALGLRGVLVSRGKRYVGFALASEMRSDVLQGHFSKCLDRERGSSLFVIRACSVAEMGRYAYTNLEDDMGNKGLRQFKRSLHAETVASYTVRFKKRESVL